MHTHRSIFVATGLMLFALFFGAGNLIFPALMGQQAGDHIFAAMSGFLLTGAGLPLLGVIAVGYSGSRDVQDLASRVTPWYGTLFAVMLYLAIGPLFAIPRTATVSFEIGVAPFLAIFGAIPLHSVLKGLVSTPHGHLPSARFLRLALGSGLGVFLLQISGTFHSVWAMSAVGALGFVLSTFTLPRLLPKGTFKLKRGIPALVMTRLLMMGAVTGAEVVMPLLLQRIHGWSANRASLAVTIATLSWASGAFIQSQFKNRRVRLLLPKIGSCMIVIGLAPLSMLLNPSLPKWPVFIAWLLSGIGVGFTHSTISDFTLGSTDPSMHGRASSWLQVADSAGAAVELAFVSLALALWSALGFTGPIAYLPATFIALSIAVVGVFAAMRTREEDLLPRASV